MANEALLAKRLAAIHSDVRVFFKYCAFTYDESDPNTAKKPFPTHIPYINAILGEIQSHPKLVFEKSRQLMVSWIFAGHFAWEILTKTNVQILVFAQDEKKAIEFGKRVAFICNNVPEWVWPRSIRPRVEPTQDQISVPSLNSKVIILTSAPNKGHGYTPTATLFDEFGYHPNAAESFRAIIGGAVKIHSRVYVVSTPPPILGDGANKFYQICDDELDNEDFEPTAATISDMDELCLGVRARTNQKNTFRYIRVHHSADPARDEAWKAAMIAINGERDFAISHDLQRVHFGGQGVFSDLYNPYVHEVNEVLMPHPRFGPVVLGWDFGGNHSIVAMQRQGADIAILREFPNMGFGTVDISRDVYAHLQAEWGHLNLHYIDGCDPAGRDAGKETDNKSCLDALMAQAKLMGRGYADVRVPRTNLIKPRLEAWRELLRGETGNLQIGTNCPYLRKALRGAYCWPENIGKGRKAEPEKNSYSHTVDAGGYGIMVLQMLRPHQVAVIQGAGRFSYLTEDEYGQS